MAFIDVITGISGLTHYYPLDNVHKTNDAWGGTAGAGAGHPAVNFVNQGYGLATITPERGERTRARPGAAGRRV